MIRGLAGLAPSGNATRKSGRISNKLEPLVVARTFFVFLLSMTLAACAGGPPLRSSESLTVTSATALPPPQGVASVGDPSIYRIGPFDRLSVSVLSVPELTQNVQVDASGRIALPLIGSLEASGKTPDELTEEIGSRLRGRYVRDPQVAVNVAETVSHVVTVEGEVREPGLYPVLGNMTLLRSIASAKGTSEFARLDDVVIFRTVGDQHFAALYNLRAIRRGAYPDPTVYANDVVVVGDSPARRLFRDILTAAPLLTTPLIALIQRP